MRFGVRRITGILIPFALVMAIGPVCQGFDLPDSDPWYFQSDEAGYEVKVPDKALHFYGSALLNELGKQLPLPKKEVFSPALVFTAGFLWEVWQHTRGVGFSQKDLAADALGVLSSQLRSETFSMVLDYSVSDETITIRFTQLL